jgi:exodeoxyribonuclease VII large subunit
MDVSPPPVLPVSLFVSSARLLLERHLGLVWVAGEVSGCSRAPSGHLYFTLKDANAQVRCVFFRLKAQHLDFVLKDGLAVEVRATPSIYEARGEFQLNVDNVRLAGLGAQYEQFARLKARLSAAGWFEAARKKPLPPYPSRIGVVTSTHGAALHDVLSTLARRWPALRVTIYPASVQGDAAPQEIATAIRRANARAETDVLIVCRGGGSLTDLFAFNHETVARAVFDSILPIVSGVGHETDFTICDFVADARAPTPTGAAALVVPDAAALRRKVAELGRRLLRAHAHVIATRAQRLDAAAGRLTHPAARLLQQAEHAGRLARRLQQCWHARWGSWDAKTASVGARLLLELRTPLPQRARLRQGLDAWQRAGTSRIEGLQRRMESLQTHLVHLNPQSVLERGYAIVAADNGRIVTTASQVESGDRVTITFARGNAQATIDERKV